MLQIFDFFFFFLKLFIKEGNEILFYQFLKPISSFKIQTRCVPPFMLFAGSQMLGTGLPTCVSGVASHRGRTVGRLLERLQACGPRPVPREMAPGAPALLLLSLLSLPGLPPRAAACPAACRCYSATVECGALRLRVVPPGIPPGTQVGTAWGCRAAVRGASETEGRVCEPPRG